MWLIYFTEVSSFLNIIPQHYNACFPAWHEFKNTIMVEIGHLHLSPFTKSHYWESCDLPTATSTVLTNDLLWVLILQHSNATPHGTQPHRLSHSVTQTYCESCNDFSFNFNDMGNVTHQVGKKYFNSLDRLTVSNSEDWWQELGVRSTVWHSSSLHEDAETGVGKGKKIQRKIFPLLTISTVKVNGNHRLSFKPPTKKTSFTSLTVLFTLPSHSPMFCSRLHSSHCPGHTFLHVPLWSVHTFTFLNVLFAPSFTLLNAHLFQMPLLNH
jgi:hypothetical protein